VISHRPARPPFLARFGVPLAMVVGLAIGLPVGFALRGPEQPAVPVVMPDAAPTRATVTHDPSVPTTPTSSVPPSVTRSPTATTTKLPVTAFTDGGFYVATAGSMRDLTIAPGTYRSLGAAACSWERRTGSDVEQDQTAGPVTIRLQAGQFFTSTGCAPWTRVRTG
jgi:hypothetical protein